MEKLNCYVKTFRDHFYQFGEIRSVTMVARQQCAFVQFVSRGSAEQAAEKSFNKLIIKGRRLNIKWGRAQGQQPMIRQEEEEAHHLPPVPGLPGGKYFCLVKLMKSISQGYVIWLTGIELHATWNSFSLYFLAIGILWHEQEVHFSKYD